MDISVEIFFMRNSTANNRFASSKDCKALMFQFPWRYACCALQCRFACLIILMLVAGYVLASFGWYNNVPVLKRSTVHQRNISLLMISVASPNPSCVPNLKLLASVVAEMNRVPTFWMLPSPDPL